MRAAAGTIAGLRRQDWAFFAWTFAIGGIVSAVVRRDPVEGSVWTAVLVVAGIMARRWSRLYPAPMPAAMRGILYLSHPGLSPRRLQRILATHADERLLEIGPGIGHYALPTAALLGPRGHLAVVDIQAAMLAALTRRATTRDVYDIAAVGGDVQRLPFRDATFDGAYLVTVLGEVPDPARALRELARVVKPGGRIVTGELIVDPDYVALPRLGELAAAAGLVVRAHTGSRLAYFARLEAA